jgi:hypothetical protein
MLEGTDISFSPKTAMQVIRYPSIGKYTKSSNQPAQVTVKELVFIGDMTMISGLKVFCDSIDALIKERTTFDYKITFIGNENTIMGMSSTEYIQLRAKKWSYRRVTWTVKSDLDMFGILEYMGSVPEGRLAVLPSLVDVSALVEQELLSTGVAFIGSDQSSIVNVLDATTAAKILVSPDAALLTKKLAFALDHQGIYSTAFFVL